ncbi:hypothetical protein ACTFIZ_000787 [Dictyostelium cf. discoideum]
MKIKILLILILNLIFLNSIVNSQIARNYYVANNGTDYSYCGQAISQACATPVGAVNSFRTQFGYYSSNTYQLVVNFGSGYQWNGGNSLSSVTLNNMNVSFIGAPDGSTYFYNSYSYLPLFNITSSQTQSTYITFTNISYGSPSFSCYHNYQYNTLAASFLLITPGYYYSVNNYIQFNNLSLSCKTLDIPIVATNGYGSTYLGPASEDYNDYYTGPMSSYQPNTFITFNGLYFNQSASYSITGNTAFSLSSQLINVPIFPTSVSIVNSVFIFNNIYYSAQAESFINIGRGNLIIDNSTFVVSSFSNNPPPFVTVSSAQVDITNSIITTEGMIINFLSCQGCFFKADNINYTSLSITSSSVPFDFIYASASFYNSRLVSSQYSGIIGMVDSQLALRSNIIASAKTYSVNLDKVNAFIYGNNFPYFYQVPNSYWFNSYSTIFYCSSDSESDIVGDYTVGSYTENCSKYTKDFKLKWYFGFLAVGIVGTLFIYIFLASTIAIIKRCGGGNH